MLPGETPALTCMFLDIGGVLLTDGWDHHARKRAAKRFKLEWAGMEERHSLNFDIFEAGKLTLEEYLGRMVFYQKRPFSRSEFRRFMFAPPRLDQLNLQTQGKLRIENRRGQQRSTRTECFLHVHLSIHIIVARGFAGLPVGSRPRRSAASLAP
jgi:hypothetical protein